MMIICYLINHDFPSFFPSHHFFQKTSNRGAIDRIGGSCFHHSEVGPAHHRTRRDLRAADGCWDESKAIKKLTGWWLGRLV